MVTGISIGKIVFKKLSEDEALKAIVGDKIYPLVAREGVSFPFVTFSSEIVQPKNAYKYDNIDKVSFVVVCVSDNYDDVTDVSEAVREALNLDEVIFISAEEDYQEGAFVKILNFEIEWKL